MRTIGFACLPDRIKARPLAWASLLAAGVLAAPLLVTPASAQSLYEQQRGEQVQHESMQQLQESARGVQQSIQQSNRDISARAAQQLNERMMEQRTQQQILSQPPLVVSPALPRIR